MRLPYKKEPLRYVDRCLRTHEGKLLFGPSGNRLFVDILEKRPGFLGCFDFIHKANIPKLFSISDNFHTNFKTAEFVWYPTHMTMLLENDFLSCKEVKTILDDDVAFSVSSWENHSDCELILKFDFTQDSFESQMAPPADGCFQNFLSSPLLRFGIRAGLAVGWNFPAPQITIKPKQRATVLAVAAMGNLATEPKEEILQKISFYLAKQAEPFDLIRDVIHKNEKFYQDAPVFISDDKMINACWEYRWYILKNAMSKPNFGYFSETVLYEGRDHRMKKTPLKPDGWEFNKLIPLSTPLQVNDLRWHNNRELTKEIIRSAFAGQNEEGLLLCTYVNETFRSYANYMIWSIWLFYLLDGDKDFIRSLVPRMKKYIHGHEKVYTDSRDHLLIEEDHGLTGKEFQPSYWYFCGYPDNVEGLKHYTPLKRVDRSVYHYLNLCGLSNLLRTLGDSEYAVYQQKAEQLRESINQKMWDPETEYYYDLHYKTDQKALVRNIVGVYPFWAGIDEKRHANGILPLMDPEAFDLGAAYPSVSKDCPAFSPEGGWRGIFLKGRNGCVWCGPSWPYTTGIALAALGSQSRKYNHRFDDDFDRHFSQYTAQHFRDEDYTRPYLVEHYNPITGERLSDEADYNHSFWIDLVLSYVVGLTVKEDYIEIVPLKTHINYFTLDNLWIRGHKIKMEYEKGNGHTDANMTVYVDNIRQKNGTPKIRIDI